MNMRTTVTFILAALFCGSFLLAAPEPTPNETKGKITGVIVKKDGSRITVGGQNTRLTLMPYWRGGMPKDGGGLEKDMVKRLEEFKVGDKVKVTWTFEEHYRIDTIKLVKRAE